MTFQPFEIIQGQLERGLLLVADHAMRRLPEAHGTLGLPPQAFERHIAYDIGIEPLTRALAATLGVPAVMATFSRLLIDPNRGSDDPTLIRQIYDRTLVPGNATLTGAERDHRINSYYAPYHAAIAHMIAETARVSGRAPLVISLHSFTPRLDGGAQRPWHCGLLWDADPRAAHDAAWKLAGLSTIAVHAGEARQKPVDIGDQPVPVEQKVEGNDRHQHQ